MPASDGFVEDDFVEPEFVEGGGEPQIHVESIELVADTGAYFADIVVEEPEE